MDKRLYDKIRQKAKYYCRGGKDWEDIANEVALDWLTHNRKGQTFDQAFADALRRLYGRKGTQRHSINEAIRSAVRLDTAAPDGGIAHDFIGEQQNCSGEIDCSRIDPQLVKRCPKFEIRQDVSESRNSQLRTAHYQKFLREYLWQHYQEYGIDSDLEIEWITI